MKGKDADVKDKFVVAVREAADFKDEGLEKLLCERIPAMQRFHEFLDMLLSKSEYSKACFIVGPAGTRKSYHVEEELRRRGTEFVTYNSHSTPLGLYEILYTHPNGVIVLDDIDAITEDKRSINILKAATFNASGEREITWQSTTKVLRERGLPARFVFSGKIIIIANDLNRSQKETFKAFLNRMYVHEIVLSISERKELVRTVFMRQPVFELDDAGKLGLLELMEKALTFGNADKYNLRTAFKAAEMWKHLGEDKAKSLIYALLETNEMARKFLILEEGAAGLPVKKRVELWKQTTGYSQATYFRLKDKYRVASFSTQMALDEERNSILAAITEAAEERAEK